MINFMLSGLLLLCSAAYISGSDQKKYTIMVSDEFRGKKHTYGVNLTPEESKNVEVAKKWVKEVGYMVLLPHVPADVTSYGEIKQILHNCTIHLFCTNKRTNKILELNDPSVEQGICAGTHQLKAAVYRENLA